MNALIIMFGFLTLCFGVIYSCCAVVVAPVLVVGVDFGTTYSGFSYALWDKTFAEGYVCDYNYSDFILSHSLHFFMISAQSKVELFDVLEWPGQSVPYAKTPTVMLYDGNRLTQWGWPAENDREDKLEQSFVQRVKLHLAPKNIEGRENLDANAIAPLPAGTTPVRIIADYLRALKTFIFFTFDRQGIKVLPKDVRWCLTVPAMWDDDGKDVMSRAAQLAGMAASSYLCTDND